MKKIIALIFSLLTVVLAIYGYQYYTNTYQGQVAYAAVPSTVPAKTATKDDDGKIIDRYYSYNYTLTFVKADGSKQTMPYSVSNENPKPLKPNSYIKVKISSKRILEGPVNVSRSTLPAKIQSSLTQ